MCFFPLQLLQLKHIWFLCPIHIDNEVETKINIASVDFISQQGQTNTGFDHLL